MTQVNRTEEVLDRGYHWEAIAEARALARKLDEIALWGELHSNEDVRDAIRAIMEADQ